MPKTTTAVRQFKIDFHDVRRDGIVAVQGDAELGDKVQVGNADVGYQNGIVERVDARTHLAWVRVLRSKTGAPSK